MDGHYRPLIYMRPLAIRGVQWALSLQKAILDTPKINMMARVLSNSHCSSLKIIQINNQPFVLCHGCFIQIFMQMGVFAWTFYKTSGVQYMILLLYLPPDKQGLSSSPANSEAARIYSENKREYNRKVCDVVEQNWTATSSS
ncbi:unnamed protein product [Brassica rapa subsp. trilocularis]